MNAITKPDRKFSIPSIIAVVAAVLSFASGAFFGLIMAAIAIIAGAIGIGLAIAPSNRGGIASTFAIIAGLVGVIAALFKAIAWLF